MAQHIVAIGGGGFSDAEMLTPLDHYLIGLTAKRRPRVCFLGTASGDSDRYAAKFYRAYAPVADASDLVLFGAPDRGAVARLETQDLIFVGGGNTANMLAVWRLHGVDETLRRAWQAGTVLAGISAGAICWFEACLTDSFGSELAPLNDGLALLPGSACPHLASDPLRRSRYAEEISAGRLPTGYGIEDGAALCFEGTQLVAVVTEVVGRAAWQLELRNGVVDERRLDAVTLPGATELD